MKQSKRKLYHESEIPEELKEYFEEIDKEEYPVDSAIVGDFFSGAGTTIMVANQLGRRGIGIDLSHEYAKLAYERVGAKALQEWQQGKIVEANWEDMPLFKQNV